MLLIALGCPEGLERLVDCLGLDTFEVQGFYIIILVQEFVAKRLSFIVLCFRPIMEACITGKFYKATLRGSNLRLLGGNTSIYLNTSIYVPDVLSHFIAGAL